MVQRNFLVHTDYTDYNLTIEITANQSIMLSLGGKKKGCVLIQVQKMQTDDRKNELMKTTSAYIVAIEADSKCNTSGDLAPKIGTQHMIRTAMNVTMRLAKWVTRFHLSDASQRACRPNGQMVSLSKFLIALEGHTWYEKTFAAKLEMPTSWQSYKQALDKFGEKPMPFDVFKHGYLTNVTYPLTEVKRVYNRANTYREFFASLRTLFPKMEDLCEFMQPWVETFVNTMLGHGRFFSEYWTIAKANVPTIAFTMKQLVDSPYVVGGSLKKALERRHDSPKHMVDPRRRLYNLRV